MQRCERKNLWLFIVLGCIIGLLCDIKGAFALPAFARQLGEVRCTTCHTIWPRLNAFGRQFKVRGYVDRAPDAVTKWPPVSVMLTGGVQQQRVKTTGDDGSITSAQTTRLHVPHSVEVLVGSALTPRLGLFMVTTMEKEFPAPGEPDTSFFPPALEFMKVAYNLKKGYPASVLLFKGNIFSADPYSSLGGMDRRVIPGDIAEPNFLVDGVLSSPLDANHYGVIAHSYFGNKKQFYGAVGVETGGDAPGSNVGVNPIMRGAAAMFLRAVHEGRIGNEGGSYNIGAAYYAGDKRMRLPVASPDILNYKGKVSRLFIDGAIQLPVNSKDLVEFVALYGTGKDANINQFDPDAGTLAAPFDAKIRGIYLQGDYFWNRRLGLAAFYNRGTIQDATTDTKGASIIWLPVKDLKLALQGGQSTTGNTTTNTYQIYVVKMF